MLALVCALLLTLGLYHWTRESAVERVLIVAVAPPSLPAGFILIEGPVKQVELRVRGPKALIQALSERDVTYRPALEGDLAGVVQVPVRTRDIHLPSAVAVVEANPSFLTFTLDEELEKEVPVMVVLAGQPAGGYTVVETRVEPERVLLKGPGGTLKRVHVAVTKPVNVSQLQAVVKREIPLDLDESVEVVSTAGPVRVTVIVEVEMTVRELQGIPVKGLNASGEYVIIPEKIDLQVKGPVRTLEDLLRREKVEVFVDLEGLSTGVYTRRATIKLPVDTTLLDASPEVFTVRIQ